jgi:TatD DNase family protein
MIDTHAHLNDTAFDLDRGEVIQRAHDNGVGTILDVTEDIASAEKSLSLFSENDRIWTAVGLHPHVARALNSDEIQKFRSLIAHPKVIAVGEIGLDYYYNHQPHELQQQAFHQMLELACEADLPVIIHNRDSDDDLIRILREFIPKKIRGVIHCFTSTLETAKKLLEMGFYISFSGIVTFKTAEDLRKVVEEVPLNRLMVETDAPYLTPVPMRGKKNEPFFVKHTAEQVVKLKKTSMQEFERILSGNVKNLFTKIKTTVY